MASRRSRDEAELIEVATWVAVWEVATWILVSRPGNPTVGGNEVAT